MVFVICRNFCSVLQSSELSAMYMLRRTACDVCNVLTNIICRTGCSICQLQNCPQCLQYTVSGRFDSQRTFALVCSLLLAFVKYKGDVSLNNTRLLTVSLHARGEPLLISLTVARQDK
jgi:hypothetical protein